MRFKKDVLYKTFKKEGTQKIICLTKLLLHQIFLVFLVLYFVSGIAVVPWGTFWVFRKT